MGEARDDPSQGGTPGVSASQGSEGSAARAAGLLGAAFQASPVGLALLAGPRLLFLEANRAYRALLPEPGRDPLGRTFEEVWAGADPTMRDAARIALETGVASHRPDLAHPAGAGPRRLSFHAERVESGGRVAVLLSTWETTAYAQARHAAEEAAERALGRAAEWEAIDAIADAVFLFGPGGRVLRRNGAASRLLDGREPALAPGAGPGAGLGLLRRDGGPLPPAEDPVSRALSGETVHGVHLRLGLRAGRVAWVVAGAAPIRTPGGGVAGAVLTLADESDVHELEEARDDLVRMISHDLRTPLNAVATQAHLLQRAPGDPVRVEERARAIGRSCSRMAAMIQDLVEATQLEAGQLMLARAPVDVGALLGELLERLRGGLDVDRVRLSLSSGVPAADADPLRLERILVNLLSNALKYSPPQTEVAVGLERGAGGLVLVTITDRGVGIGPEDRLQIFERWFRARGERRPEGLGLGLYITRLLVEAHGGRVEVESELGQGSTFRVYLPAHGALPSPAPAT